MAAAPGYRWQVTTNGHPVIATWTKVGARRVRRRLRRTGFLEVVEIQRVP